MDNLEATLYKKLLRKGCFADYYIYTTSRNRMRIIGM
jgi:hypothetical protein